MKLKFRYSLLADLRWIFRTFRDARGLEEKGLVVFRPSLKNMFSLWRERPGAIDIEVIRPMTCYWISAGTWGAFTPPDRIYICPWKKGGGAYTANEMKRTMYHELFHLYYYDDTRDMSFADREAFVNQKMKDELGRRNDSKS